MFVLDNYGIPLTFAKIVPGNTITSILPTYSEFVTYTERTVAYTGGGTTEIVAGDWIVGATSSAKAEVVSLTLTGGTWAGGDAAGVMRLRSSQGTWTSGENVKVAAGTDDATITLVPKIDQGDYPFKGMTARAMRVTVAAQTALCSWQGGRPDQTALMGTAFPAVSTTVFTDIDAIRQFKCVDYTAGSASTLNVTFYF